MVFVSIFSSEKNQLQVGKIVKLSNFFFSPLFVKKAEQIIFDAIFTCKHSILKPCSKYETMDSVSILGPQITELKYKKTKKKFFSKIK